MSTGAANMKNRSAVEKEDEKSLLLGRDIGMASPVSVYSRCTTQVIAHRGFKARYPENTMKAFQAAIEIGAHALETDVHLSSNSVVMLSHDATLTRCFGVKKRIIECDSAYLSTLRTLQEPHEHMPTLKELLEYLCQPVASEKWLLLDIKLDNNPDDIIRLIGTTINSVHEGARFWKGRIVLGIWALFYLPLCEKYLPGFPIVHIGRSLSYSRAFLGHNDVSFNLHWSNLSTKCGRRFMKDAADAGRSVYTWTINDEQIMKWAIREELIDGACTDDPAKFLELCNSYNAETWCFETWSLRDYWLLFVNLVFSWVGKMLLMWYFEFGGPDEMRKHRRLQFPDSDEAGKNWEEEKKCKYSTR